MNNTPITKTEFCATVKEKEDYVKSGTSDTTSIQSMYRLELRLLLYVCNNLKTDLQERLKLNPHKTINDYFKEAGKYFLGIFHKKQLAD